MGHGDECSSRVFGSPLVAVLHGWLYIFPKCVAKPPPEGKAGS